MPGAVGESAAPDPTNTKDVGTTPAEGRLPLKRKAVPLLPSLTEDEASWNYIDEKIKHAREMISSSVSLKPAKLARYDQQAEMKGSPEEKKDIVRRGESFSPGSGIGFGLRHNVVDFSVVGMSLSAYDVIPLDKLRFEERHTPLDVKAFLSRVGTFDLRMWSGKPDRLSAFQCARYGFRVAGKNTLVCVSCRNMLSIPHDHGCSKLDEWISNIENQIQKTGHMSDCIWVRSPSPTNILLLPEGNDMQTYMHQAAQSFKRMRSLPVLTGRYRLIMDVLDMCGLKEKTDLQLMQNIAGNSTEVIEQCALFLMMNGWTMDDMDINALQCHLCLRQVPLWLCLSPSSENQDVPAASGLPRKHIKELDPIVSHWFWCPWRKLLQSSDPEKSLHDFLEVESTNIFDAENLAQDDIVPNLDAYMTLAVKIDGDFKRGRLVRGRESLEMADNNIAISTLKTFKELLNALQSGSNSPSSVPAGDNILPSDLKNELISIKASKAKLLCTKLLHETPEADTITPVILSQNDVPTDDGTGKNALVTSNIVESSEHMASEERSHSYSEELAPKEGEVVESVVSVQEDLASPVSVALEQSHTIEAFEEVKVVIDEELNQTQTVRQTATANDIQDEKVIDEPSFEIDLAIGSENMETPEICAKESIQLISGDEEPTGSLHESEPPFLLQHESQIAEEAKETNKGAVNEAEVFEQLVEEEETAPAAYGQTPETPGFMNTTIPDNHERGTENSEGGGVSSEMNEGPGSLGNQSPCDVAARALEVDLDDKEEGSRSGESAAISNENRADHDNEIRQGQNEDSNEYEQAGLEEGAEDDHSDHSDYYDEENDMYPDDDEDNEMSNDDDSPGGERGESFNSSNSNHSDSDDDIVCLD